MRIFVIDIGGTNVKLWGADGMPLGKVPSSRVLTPSRMVEEVHRAADPATYDAVSIGYPGQLVQGRPSREPLNLGPGWVGFDFAARFEKPLRIMNDAAMQALGSYEGGRMLFLGLGTSVGSALIVDDIVVPMELGSMPHAFGETLEDLLARSALDRLGKRKWRRAVLDALPRLKEAFVADYVVLGGGNVKKLDGNLPPDVRRGGNHDAFRGGCRLRQSNDRVTTLVFDSRSDTCRPADPETCSE